ncbi:DUF4389 domain-containing protein [Nitrosomonas sp. Nm166]|uniref:DUF4389 domain-containing protein n=1 Tax=Nitrosomonas sp. Nm166 TaxID=1881054 RepID=UPI0008E0E2D8|nr:DUF4389 domain-containing protein [Nitrosomonas sp. Nm166]SFD97225.1 Putative ABC-transporter type IV [Nitrosomonas sp. Nm166]
MKEEIKRRLQKNETWQRGFYMLFFIFIYGVSKFLVIAVMLFQFFTMIVTGTVNEQLLKFGQNLSTYLYQITMFLTFNSEQLPFPFSAWPQGTPNQKYYLDES